MARIAALPAGWWEAAEIRFAQALLTFDPSRLQPEPPAYPVYVALGRMVHVFVRDGFIALVTLSVIASILAALLIGRLASSIFASPWAGAATAAVVLLSPALLVFGPLPNAESVALALVAGTFTALAAGRGDLFAFLAAASIGARPQIAAAMVAAVIAGSFVIAARARIAVIFLITLTAIFVPVVEAAGFPRAVEMSLRPESFVRFVAHPWGGKLLSFPLLAFAAAGAVTAARRYRSVPVAAIVTFTAVHIATALLFASEFDGVRPVLPSLLGVGLLAIAAVARWPLIAAALSAVFAIASHAYTRPLLDARRTLSPAMQAARAMPRSVVVADPDLAPFGPFVTPERHDEIVRRNPVHLHLLMHGRSEVAGARSFEWRDSDAYGKLTTERFRVVSLVPQPPSRRYAARSGVYPHESSPERGEWRWLSPRAEIELPSLSGATVALRLRLPADAPIESNRITIGSTIVDVTRGRTVEAIVPAHRVLTIESARSFSPGDGRELAVQLVGIEQRVIPSGAGGAPPPAQIPR